MKLSAPAFFRAFVCIADKCRHSCCLGWEIDIDEATHEKYRTHTGVYAQELRASIAEGETPHFRLTKDDRCPHLDERGLCRIITHCGEGYLCDICREHPRFYHETAQGREVGLGMACEEACRLILSSDRYDEIEEIGAIEGSPAPFAFDSTVARRHIYGILKDTALPYTARLAKIAEAYHTSLALHTDEEWRECFSLLEYLDEAHRALFAHFSSDDSTPKATEPLLARAFAYLIYRHLSPVLNEDELSAAVGFSLLCERLLASLVRAGIEIHEAARILSEEIEYSEENTDLLKCEFLF